jgi:maleate isomerase
MKLSFDTDAGPGEKAALGLIVLRADETIESEFRGLFDIDGVSLFHSRIESAPQVTPETLLQMKAELAGAAALLPDTRPLDAVAYACTSGATMIGPEAVADAIRAVHPHAQITNPASAVAAALNHLKVRRVGVVSPYVARVSDAVCAFLSENGMDPVTVGSFDQGEEAIVARIALASVEEAICAVGDNPQVEAVFASCTNLRTLAVIERCEKRLGKPVISSNLALAWHMMALAGLPLKAAGPGRLFHE